MAALPQRPGPRRGTPERHCPERGIHAQAVARHDAGGDVDGHFVGRRGSGHRWRHADADLWLASDFRRWRHYSDRDWTMRYLCYPRFHQVHGVAWRPRRNGGAAGAQIRPRADDRTGHTLSVGPGGRQRLDARFSYRTIPRWLGNGHGARVVVVRA